MSMDEIKKKFQLRKNKDNKKKSNDQIWYKNQMSRDEIEENK